MVVYHTTGWAFLSIVFPAMSVMFALAGSLMAASLDRRRRVGIGAENAGSPARGATVAVRRRLHRLLPSLWVLAALLVPAMLLTGLPVTWRLVLWLVPVADPPSNEWGALATSTIWYLRDYLWFVLASPLALWLFRRWPVPTLLAPYAGLLVVELGWPTAPQALREFGLYFGAWLLGFAHHDGMLRRMSRRVLVPVAVALAGAGLAWIYTHPGPRGFDLNDIRLGNGLWSAGFVLLLLGLAPAGAGWVDRYAGFGRIVTVLNRRALTVYLWHMPIVIGLTALAIRLGWDLSTWTGVALRVAIVIAAVAVAVLLFGWVEDLAAGRRPVLLPGGAARIPVARIPAARPAAAPGAAARAVPARSAAAPRRIAGTAPTGWIAGTAPARWIAGTAPARRIAGTAPARPRVPVPRGAPDSADDRVRLVEKYPSHSMGVPRPSRS